MAGPRKWRIRLEDGRVLDLNADTTITDERAARRYAEQWAAINPADGEVSNYNVTLDDGRVIPVPATSEEAAQRFVSEVYTPTGRAYNDARQLLADSHTDWRGESTGQWDAADQATNAATFGLTRLTNAGINAGLTGIENTAADFGIGEGAGYSAGDAFNAYRSAERAAQMEWEREHPGQAITSSLLGGAASPLSRLGGEFAVGQQGGRGLFASQALLPSATRSAAVGGAAGAVMGATNSEPGDELASTARGGLLGGITGGAVPVAARGANAVVRATGLDQLPAVANRVTGGRIPALAGSTERRNLNRLAEALRADGISEDQIRAALNDAVRRGITPNLLDLVGPNATRTRALIVGAAQRPGPGQTAGAQYANDVRATLTDDALDQAYRLTPGEVRGAQEFADDLGRANRQIADVNYAAPYAMRVDVGDETRRALQGMGPQMQAARQESSFRFPEQADDIARLAQGEADQVSAAALDRVNRQIAQAGRNAAIPGDNQNLGLAADYGARRAAIDESLDAVPELLPARAAFRGYANAEEGVDAGLGALSPQTRPAEYINKLDDLMRAEAAAEMAAGIPIPSAREAAGVGLRDEIVQRLGRGREGATGPLNDLASRAEGGNARRVLDATYGDEIASDFQGAMATLRDRGALANFMDSTRGSPTAGRNAADEFANAPGIPITIQSAMNLLNRVRRGVTLTDADREMLVRLGTRFQNTPPPVNLGPRGIPISGRAAPILAAQAGG